MIRTNKTKSGRVNGSASIELPMCLFFLFILFVFPLIDLATIGLRVSTIFSAAREAGRAAGRSKTFLADTPEGPSATTIAKQQAVSQSGPVAHISASNVKLQIVGTPLKPGAPPIRQSTPLGEALPKDYVYQLEVEVVGTVDPLVVLDSKVFGEVPGLTIPLSVTARSSEVAEFPAGLTK